MSNEELRVVEFHAVEHDREQQRREERDPYHRVCVCVSVCLCVLGTLVVVLSVRYTRIDPPVRCILGCLPQHEVGQSSRVEPACSSSSHFWSFVMETG